MTLRKKCPYLELFWSAFSLIRTEYGEILSISPYSVSMWENADQNNSEYGHLLHSVIRTCAYQRVINISFSDNFAYVLKGWCLDWLLIISGIGVNCNLQRARFLLESHGSLTSTEFQIFWIETNIANKTNYLRNYVSQFQQTPTIRYIGSYFWRNQRQNVRKPIHLCLFLTCQCPTPWRVIWLLASSVLNLTQILGNIGGNMFC